MVLEASAAVEFDRRVAVSYLQMKELGVAFAGRFFCQLKEVRSNSLPSVRLSDEEFVDPRAFATFAVARAVRRSMNAILPVGRKSNATPW